VKGKSVVEFKYGKGVCREMPWLQNEKRETV
jgi:hypothetical protein